MKQARLMLGGGLLYAFHGFSEPPLVCVIVVQRRPNRHV